MLAGIATVSRPIPRGPVPEQLELVAQAPALARSAIAEPFHLGHARQYDLATVAREYGARFLRDRVAAVRPEERVVRLAGGDELAYDQLVLAVGAQPTRAFTHAITFGDDPAEERLHGMLADLETGYLRRVAFVVPGDAAWTLPLYEIALMTARQAWSMGMDKVRFTLVTPEERPLAMFGTAASDAVGELLAAHAIEFVGDSYAEARRSDRPVARDGRRPHRRAVRLRARAADRRLAGFERRVDAVRDGVHVTRRRRRAAAARAPRSTRRAAPSRRGRPASGRGRSRDRRPRAPRRARRSAR